MCCNVVVTNIDTINVIIPSSLKLRKSAYIDDRECDDTDNILYLGECSNYDDNSNDEDVKDACEEIVIKYNRLIAEYVDSTQNRNTSLPLFSPGTTDGAPYQCNPPLR